jgi:hypothetical protein
MGLSITTWPIHPYGNHASNTCRQPTDGNLGDNVSSAHDNSNEFIERLVFVNILALFFMFAMPQTPYKA